MLTFIETENAKSLHTNKKESVANQIHQIQYTSTKIKKKTRGNHSTGDGTKSETWDRVLNDLKRDSDGRGQPPLFEGVSIKTCQKKWDAKSAEQKELVANVLNATRTVPVNDERERAIDEIYTAQVEAQRNGTSFREANQQKRKTRPTTQHSFT
ncbi:hypothetical protein BGZ58_010007 [Dissophora ornata]|nr:hypothetical protein BGZ58_010007 [Dissophora ornata]